MELGRARTADLLGAISAKTIAHVRRRFSGLLTREDAERAAAS
jgi:hypothetical protein